VKYAGAPLLVALMGVVGYIVHQAYSGTETVRFGAFTHGNAQEIGAKLFKEYLLPFEITSVLVLIAIVGAIVLAQKEVE
jgi:NADH-quinone oxidoreductase subunit J